IRDLYVTGVQTCALPIYFLGNIPAVRVRLEADAHGGDVAEEVEGLGHREVEHFRDAPTLELHLERLPVVAAATADLARDVDVGKEMHLDRDHALARAGLAAAPLHVEGEAAGSVASRASFGQLREQVTDRAEGARVRRRVR